MYVISDDILERLLCSLCKKYLSVKPVKIYPNRGIKCGRCSSHDDAGLVSLFDMVVKEGLFRCVNRYEGCNKLLAYGDTAEHEKTCKGGYYDCPLCVGFKGSAYEILNHYKSLHKDKFLEAPEVWVQLENESYEVYLYKKNDFLFFVNVKFSISEDELTVMIELIGAKENFKKIEHSMNVHSLEGPKAKSRKKMCPSVAEQDPKMFKFILKLDDFPKNIAICKFYLNTEPIERLLAVPEKCGTFSFRSSSAKNDSLTTKTAETDAANPTPTAQIFMPVTLPNSFSIFPAATTSSTPFAASATTISTPFAASAMTTATTSSIFGASAMTTANTSTLFGSTTNTTSSLFAPSGMTTTTTSGIFGAASTTSASRSIFGVPARNGQPNALKAGLSAAANTPVRPATFNPHAKPFNPEGLFGKDIINK